MNQKPKTLALRRSAETNLPIFRATACLQAVWSALLASKQWHYGGQLAGKFHPAARITSCRKCDCRTWLVLLSISLLPNLGWTSESVIDQEVRFADLTGKSFLLKAPADRRALVLIFVTTDCPIANSYQPKLSRLFQEFQKKGFAFAIVHEGPEQSPEKLKVHAKEYDIPFSIVMDADHSIARATGATKTPEAFVFDPQGAIQYQGRIDNLYQGFGKKRAAATRDDLSIAMSELVEGKPVSVPKTDAVGCSIPVK